MFSQFIKLINDHQINSADGTAVGVGVLAVLKWLPEVSALLSIVWIGLRIWVTIRDEFLNKEDKKNGDKRLD
jgi:hypothetical protein